MLSIVKTMGILTQILVEFTDYAVDLEDSSIYNIPLANWTKLINGYRIIYTAGYDSSS